MAFERSRDVSSSDGDSSFSGVSVMDVIIVECRCWSRERRINEGNWSSSSNSCLEFIPRWRANMRSIRRSFVSLRATPRTGCVPTTLQYGEMNGSNKMIKHSSFCGKIVENAFDGQLHRATSHEPRITSHEPLSFLIQCSTFSFVKT